MFWKVLNPLLPLESGKAPAAPHMQILKGHQAVFPAQEQCKDGGRTRNLWGTLRPPQGHFWGSLWFSGLVSKEVARLDLGVAMRSRDSNGETTRQGHSFLG